MSLAKAKRINQKGAVLIPIDVDRASKMSKIALYLMIALIILTVISAAVIVANVVYNNYQMEKVKVLDNIISEKAKKLKTLQSSS